MSVNQRRTILKRRPQAELKARVNRSRGAEGKGSQWMPDSEILRRRMQEVLFIIGLSASLFLLFALLSYHRGDAGWSSHSWSKVATPVHVANIEGHVGAWLADVFLYLCGYMAYLIPMMGMYLFFLLLQQAKRRQESAILYRVIGLSAIIFASCGLITLHYPASTLSASAGGILGQILGTGMAGAFNVFGASLILLGVLLVGLTLFTDCSLLGVIDVMGSLVIYAGLLLQLALFKVWARVKSKYGRSFQGEQATSPSKLRVVKSVLPKEDKMDPVLVFPKPVLTHTPPVISRLQQIELDIAGSHDAKDTHSIAHERGALPSLTLLDLPDKSIKAGYTNEQLEAMSREVELRMMDFAIEVKVVAVHPGPVVTRFELQLAPGIKVSKIVGLAKDLARSLSVISVRVVEVIPGKSVIGLELPNKHREVVRLREVLATSQYENSRSPLTLALGKDIAGHPVIVDLAKMPHLLVAGTTGAGKSVSLNAMLLSLLYKSSPQELRLIMIDPKMLELAVYEGIPHLLTPVVTDMKDAANVLRWCVAEMERRYQLMASLGVRNIIGYNKRVKDALKSGTPLLDPLWQAGVNDPEAMALQELPYIMVLVDEFADMMMAVGKKVEELICRIAQKARAAGIHLILATQRPSVDVITGLIKANIPTRIAFQVSSKIDSRTILDQQGAEQLLGNGDMLYLAPGTGVPIRVHGAFVDDGEVHKVVNALKQLGDPSYMDEVLEGPKGEGYEAMEEEGGEQDALYDQAVAIVTQTRRASISSIQRRLKIGYNRAARIVETMEAAGIVSAMESSGAREVLVAAPPEE